MCEVSPPRYQRLWQLQAYPPCILDSFFSKTSQSKKITFWSGWIWQDLFCCCAVNEFVCLLHHAKHWVLHIRSWKLTVPSQKETKHPNLPAAKTFPGVYVGTRRFNHNKNATKNVCFALRSAYLGLLHFGLPPFIYARLPARIRAARVRLPGAAGRLLRWILQLLLPCLGDA